MAKSKKNKTKKDDVFDRKKLDELVKKQLDPLKKMKFVDFRTEMVDHLKLTWETETKLTEIVVGLREDREEIVKALMGHKKDIEAIAEGTCNRLENLERIAFTLGLKVKQIDGLENSPEAIKELAELFNFELEPDLLNALLA